ncbi:MAG: DUF934 domain-containing protein [Rhodospirillales bacterium]|nr:DUF934 domain-containing protein [Rhodospirillales bacterium]
MTLLKDGRTVGDDWLEVDGDQPLPSAEAVIVSLPRWKQDRTELLGRNIRLGVRLASDEAAEDIADDLARIDLIAIEFPKFTDGRGYSTARILRERYSFKGEIRAVGNVLRDQLRFMARCGFDAVQLNSDTAELDWRDAQAEINTQYQPPV